ncbi:hypothetical protein GSI_02074 [Ganoderma sinense ZZ0214-1]|uniref:Uncharacterized protein n=1 Tax=Ganoderma sinense ZZ0214-1 TaxID=1077348 RepID=A0A2G8SP48_9APHY|nr:hypothetical protein GSI_02074 [Ganoderma sinense ZZ0214-1]
MSIKRRRHGIEQPDGTTGASTSAALSSLTTGHGIFSPRPLKDRIHLTPPLISQLTDHLPCGLALGFPRHLPLTTYKIEIHKSNKPPKHPPMEALHNDRRRHPSNLRKRVCWHTSQGRASAAQQALTDISRGHMTLPTELLPSDIGPGAALLYHTYMRLCVYDQWKSARLVIPTSSVLDRTVDRKYALSKVSQANVETRAQWFSPRTPQELPSR